MMITIQ